MHTPGPWTTKYDGSTHRWEINADHDGRCVSFIHAAVVNDGIEEANARLIAAAPELLAALEQMLPEYPRDSVNGINPTFSQCEAARDAIKKAKGE